MQINFTGHKVEITPALRTYAEEKLNKLERHFDKITSIHVVFEVETKLNQVVEATINGEVHARSESEDMYASIDALIDKLDRQLIKRKEKVKEHHHRNGSH